MALIAHEALGSYPIVSLRSKPSIESLRLRSSISFKLSGIVDGHVALQQNFLRSQHIIWRKQKLFTMKSIKGNYRNDELDYSSSKITKATVQISPMKREREVIVTEAADAATHQLSYSPEDGEDTVARSHVIQKLLDKWLVRLITQSSRHNSVAILKEKLMVDKISENQHMAFQIRSWQILKAAASHFMGLDAAISFPLLMMFIPWYILSRLAYGPEVTKELTPLWLLGPLIVALYIKIVQSLCSLYMFCFTQTLCLIKNLPSFSSSVYIFVADGRLKAPLWVLLFKPMVDIKNTDLAGLVKQKLEQLREWVVEKYLDCVESIWPHYCRTIRFLKKANLI